METGTLGIRFGGMPAGLTLSHGDLIQAVRAAKLKGDPLLDKEDSLMANRPVFSIASLHISVRSRLAG